MFRKAKPREVYRLRGSLLLGVLFAYNYSVSKLVKKSSFYGNVYIRI